MNPASPPPEDRLAGASPVQAGEPPSAPGRKLWRVGTLVYTTGALAILFFWLLLGDFALNLKDRATSPVAMLMLRGFEAPDWLVGLLVGSIPAGIGMLISPVISVFSDNHRGRWGRRIPFLLVSTPVATLGMLGLAWSPRLGSWLHAVLGAQSPGESVCKIIAFSAGWAVFEIASVVVTTLFGALINDVVPQEVMGRFYGFFRAVGLLAAIGFSYFFMGRAESHAWEILVGLALLFGVAFLLTCLMVREDKRWMAPPARNASSGSPASTQKPTLSASIKAYCRLCFTQPFYLWLFLAFTLGSLALGPVNVFSIFHARSVEMSDDAYGKCLALSYAVSLLLAYPLGSLADRFHPVRVAIGAMALYAAVTIYGFLFATGAFTFGIAFVLHTVVAGIYLTGTASIMPRLLPRKTYAQIASGGFLAGSLASMILPPGLGVLISVLNHNYNVVFILGALIALGSLASYLVLLARYKALGGDSGYRPPE